MSEFMGGLEATRILIVSYEVWEGYAAAALVLSLGVGLLAYSAVSYRRKRRNGHFAK